MTVLHQAVFDVARADTNNGKHLVGCVACDWAAVADTEAEAVTAAQEHVSIPDRPVRGQRARVLMSPNGRIAAITRYHQLEGSQLESIEQHDVTNDVLHIAAKMWPYLVEQGYIGPKKNSMILLPGGVND